MMDIELQRQSVAWHVCVDTTLRSLERTLGQMVHIETDTKSRFNHFIDSMAGLCKTLGWDSQRYCSLEGLHNKHKLMYTVSKLIKSAIVEAWKCAYGPSPCLHAGCSVDEKVAFADSFLKKQETIQKCMDLKYAVNRLEDSVIREFVTDYPACRWPSDCEKSQYFFVRPVDSLAGNSSILPSDNGSCFSVRLLDLKHPGWFTHGHRYILLVYALDDVENIIGMYSGEDYIFWRRNVYDSTSIASHLFLDGRIRGDCLNVDLQSLELAVPFSGFEGVADYKVLLKSSTRPIAIIVGNSIESELMDGVQIFSERHSLHIYRVDEFNGHKTVSLI